MLRLTLLALLGGWMGFMPEAAGAALPEGRTGEQRLASPRMSLEERTLVRRLHDARRAGDESAVRRLDARLLDLRGGWGGSGTPAGDPGPVAGAPGAPSSTEFWGSDVQISDGVFGLLSLRGLATDVDEDGTIYAAGIHAGPGTDTVAVFRSTNGGAAWTGVGAYHFAGRKIQSFALHVTDTVGGPIVGTVASATVPGARQDGALWWASFRGTGGGFRSHLILNPSEGRGFNNPALVSDGFEYSPGITWWYAAAAIVDSAGTPEGMLALRSNDFGRTWPFIDTVRSGFADGFPSIDYENVVTGTSGTRRPDAPVPDEGVLRDTLVVDANIRIGALHVRIDTLFHTRVQDLDVHLISPWGDSLELFTDIGGDGDNVIRALLTDSAASRITTGSPPFTGSWKPEASNVPSGGFSEWEGAFGAGEWVLQVRDDAAGDSGRLVSWSLWIDPFSSEEIYVSAITDFGTDTDLRVFKSDAAFGDTDGWDFSALTVDADDDLDADLAVRRSDGTLVVAVTRAAGADRDIHCHYSTDGGLTWTGPAVLAGGPGVERFPSIAAVQDTGMVPFHAAWLAGADSVMVLRGEDPAALGSAPRTSVNDRLPSIAVRPEAGGHRDGSAIRGHVLYAGVARGITYDGEERLTSAAGDPSMPFGAYLDRNFPNPFNPATVIRFTLAARGDVHLAVYDLLGREVGVLASGPAPAGEHEVLFTAGGLATGTYLLRLRAGGMVQTRKMLLIR